MYVPLLICVLVTNFPLTTVYGSAQKGVPGAKSTTAIRNSELAMAAARYSITRASLISEDGSTVFLPETGLREYGVFGTATKPSEKFLFARKGDKIASWTTSQAAHIDHKAFPGFLSTTPREQVLLASQNGKSLNLASLHEKAILLSTIVTSRRGNWPNADATISYMASYPAQPLAARIRGPSISWWVVTRGIGGVLLTEYATSVRAGNGVARRVKSSVVPQREYVGYSPESSTLYSVDKRKGRVILFQVIARKVKAIQLPKNATETTVRGNTVVCSSLGADYLLVGGTRWLSLQEYRVKALSGSGNFGLFVNDKGEAFLARLR